MVDIHRRVAAREDLITSTSGLVIEGSWFWWVNQDAGEVAEDADIMVEGNIYSSIKYCMDIIASYNCCVFFTIGWSISSALTNYSFPVVYTNYVPNYSSAAPHYHTGNTGWKASSFHTPWYWWDDANSALTTNHLIPARNAAIEDGRAHLTPPSNSYHSVKCPPNPLN